MEFDYVVVECWDFDCCIEGCFGECYWDDDVQVEVVVCEDGVWMDCDLYYDVIVFFVVW